MRDTVIIVESDGGFWRLVEDVVRPYAHRGLKRLVLPAAALRTTSILADPAITGVILPGAYSGEYFRKALGDEGFEALYHFVDNGGDLLGICAGGSVLKAVIDYTNPIKRIRREVSPWFFQGRDIGELPVREHPIEGTHGWHHATITPVQLRLPMGGVRDVRLPYWNGCYYEPAQGEKVDVLATFTDPRLGGHLPAVVRKRIGLGTVTTTSIHPEVTLHTLLASHYGPMFDYDKGEHRKKLATDLLPYEMHRQQLCGVLMEPFLRHLPRKSPLRNTAKQSVSISAPHA